MIDEIKRDLKSLDEEVQQHSIHLIGYAFEKHRGCDDGAVPVELNQLDINNDVVNDLKDALINYLANQPSELNRGSAYNALGKVYDSSLKEFLVDALNKEVEQSPTVLYQIMVALGNLGEDCFDGKESLSMFDFEENIMSAKKYLTGKK